MNMTCDFIDEWVTIETGCNTVEKGQPNANRRKYLGWTTTTLLVMLLHWGVWGGDSKTGSPTIPPSLWSGGVPCSLTPPPSDLGCSKTCFAGCHGDTASSRVKSFQMKRWLALKEKKKKKFDAKVGTAVWRTSRAAVGAAVRAMMSAA